jgi:hypothetical protein
MASYDISDIIGFINDLEKAANSMTTKGLIWTADAYLKSDQCCHEAVHKSFYGWIRRHADQIKQRDDSIFKISVSGHLEYVINKIGDVYSQIEKPDRDVVWAWMDYFVESL